jgi:lipoyl(octanoyl) transferase
LPVLRLRWLGRAPYEPTWRAMQRFTDERGAATPDEIWLLEHPPVYTLGMNADARHVLAAGDRGGQVTYHGPGQLLVYPLIDLRRAALGVRDLVTALEQSVIAYARSQHIVAQARADAPGVYVAGAKLASVGIRVRRGASYHGLALNVDMDLEPFRRINPCGYQGLAMTQLAELGNKLRLEEVAQGYVPGLLSALGFAATPLVIASDH